MARSLAALGHMAIYGHACAGKVSGSAGVIYSALTRSLTDGLIAVLSERFLQEEYEDMLLPSDAKGISLRGETGKAIDSRLRERGDR